MTDAQSNLYDALSEINHRPQPFEAYTADLLWDDEHISKQMLAFHLDETSEPATRPLGLVNRSVEWISQRFSLRAGTRVADFGCGPGIYASRLADTGAVVMGIDFSRRSIAHARSEAEKRGAKIDYILGNYLDFQTDQRFDLITLIYCDLCALSPAQRGQLLGTFRDALAAEGALLLDVFSQHAYRGRTETTKLERRLMGGFWAAEDYWGLLNTFKYEEPKVVLDKYTIVEPSRTRQIYNWLQYFSLEGLARELEQCGLRVVESYADVTGATFAEESDTIAVVVQKT